MRVHEIPTLTPEFVASFLGDRSSRKLAHNTEIRRNGLGVEVVYHQTAIVTLVADRYLVLNTGGWYTSTTFERMSCLLPNYCHISRRKGEAFVFGRRFLTPDMGVNGRAEWWHPYKDGLIFDLQTRCLVLDEIPSSVRAWISEGRGSRFVSATECQAEAIRKAEAQIVAAYV